MSHMGDGYGSKSIYASEPLVTSEVRLRRGVLEQAYADAELSPGVETEDEDALFIASPLWAIHACKLKSFAGAQHCCALGAAIPNPKFWSCGSFP